MSRFFYRLALFFYHTGIQLAALFSPKAKAWVDGRKNWEAELISWRNQQADDAPILWMHCASLGEFEQGRPVLENIRASYPAYKIVLSFYSPSGYLQQKNYAQADYICYLPADHPTNAHHWLGILRPTLAIFVKYEFWYFHLQALFQKEIPTYLIAASFRPDQIFFKWYGGLFKRLLFRFQHIFVQQASDLDLLQIHGLHQVTVGGDPRVDRVLAISKKKVDFPFIAAFKGGAQLFIAGSSWPVGEDMLLANQKHWWTSEWKLLLVPHAIDEQHIAAIIAKLQLPYYRYSQVKPGTDLSTCRVLILDTIGMLSSVYRYGDLAYIGGGFGRSIHNTLEPAAYDLPVIFGPRHQKFPEATALLECGGGFLVKDPEAFPKVFDYLQMSDNRQQASRAVATYIGANSGASQRIMDELSKQKALA